MAHAPQDDIVLVDVTKIFRLGLWRTKTAVQDLTLNVPRGQVIGLLGPNGSGKSTTLKMILGFLRPTRGDILICGRAATARGARGQIGYLPENPRFQPFLTASQVLHYYGKLLGLSGAEIGRRTDDLLDLVNLKHVAHERVRGFSKGMTQRLAVAQSILHRPRLLIFDEPMSGLDPLGRMEIRRLITRIHEEIKEATIFFSTHILGDVEALCSHVALMRSGKLAAFRPIEALLAEERQRFRIIARELPPALMDAYLRTYGATRSPAGISLTVEGTEALLARLSELHGAGARIMGISSHRRNLEEALFAEHVEPTSAGGAS